MTETPCPFAWCKITCQHAAVHVALVALLHDVAVSIRTFGGPAEVTVTAYEPGTTSTAGIPPTVLTPAAARTLGQALIARGRDRELGEALIRAADLIEGVAPNTDGEA